MIPPTPPLPLEPPKPGPEPLAPPAFTLLTLEPSPDALQPAKTQAPTTATAPKRRNCLAISPPVPHAGVDRPPGSASRPSMRRVTLAAFDATVFLRKCLIFIGSRPARPKACGRQRDRRRRIGCTAVALLFALGCRRSPPEPSENSAPSAAPAQSAAPSPPRGPARFAAAPRLVAIGDLHGDLAVTRAAL